MSDLIHDWVRQHQRLQNYMAANRELQMTPQERYAYQHHLGNLGRGGVVHDNGDISTYLSRTMGIDGRYYVLPSVWDNKIVDDKEALRRAKEIGLDKWPSYDTEDAAEARYMAIHGYMDRDVGGKLKSPIDKDKQKN